MRTKRPSPPTKRGSRLTAEKLLQAVVFLSSLLKALLFLTHLIHEWIADRMDRI